MEKVWGLEDKGKMVYKVLPMASKGESRLIFMRIGLLVILDESEDSLLQKKTSRSFGSYGVRHKRTVCVVKT